MATDPLPVASSHDSGIIPTEPWHLSVYVGEGVEAETIIDVLYTFSPLMLSIVPEHTMCPSCNSRRHYSGSVTDEAIGIYLSCDCLRPSKSHSQPRRLRRALNNVELYEALHVSCKVSIAFEVVLVYLCYLLEEASTTLSIAAWVPSRELRLYRKGKYSDLISATQRLLEELHRDLSRYCINGNVALYFAIVASKHTCTKVFDIISNYNDLILVMTSQAESVDMIRARQLAREATNITYS